MMEGIDQPRYNSRGRGLSAQNAQNVLFVLPEIVVFQVYLSKYSVSVPIYMQSN